jgi:hypothetical protein
MTTPHTQQVMDSLQQLHDANTAEMDAQAIACAMRARRFAALVGQAYGGPTTAQEDAAFSRAWSSSFDTVDALPPHRRKVHISAQTAERVIAWIAGVAVGVALAVMAGAKF